MSQTAWVRFFVSDWRGSAKVASMDLAARGLYLELLLLQAAEGPFEWKPEVLARQLRAFPAELEATWPQVRPAFEQDESGRWANPKMTEEVERGVAKRQAASGAGVAGARAKWGRELNGQKTRSERLAEARKKGRHTQSEWSAMVEHCGGRCLKCGSEGVVRDHIVPLYQGGSDAIENIQPLCQSCNAAKGPDRTDYRPDGMPGKTPGERLTSPTPTPTPTPTQSPTSTQSKKGAPGRAVRWPEVLEGLDLDDEQVHEALRDWTDMRRKRRSPLTQLAAKRAAKKLADLSRGHAPTAVAIVERSTDKGWTSFYELDDDKPRQRAGGKGDWLRDVAVED